MATAARQRTLATSKAMQFGTAAFATSPGLQLGANIGVAKAGVSARVFVAAETELLAEMYSRMLKKNPAIEVMGRDCATPYDPQVLAGSGADILLLTSRGNFLEDLNVIRSVRSSAPEVEIVMLGEIGEEQEFLQWVRAGVRGYLTREARAEELTRAILDVRAGSAVCPGRLCARLFRYFESEAKSLPSASIHQRLGLTRREQQLVPLVARGLTNKEIANYFSLSEQTVKNHLYRMKHKIGAEDRLSIVHVCRMQGFMV
jgi:DNA-binding NarL/FixJ family response regulator